LPGSLGFSTRTLDGNLHIPVLDTIPFSHFFSGPFFKIHYRTAVIRIETKKFGRSGPSLPTVRVGGLVGKNLAYSSLRPWVGGTRRLGCILRRRSASILTSSMDTITTAVRLSRKAKPSCPRTCFARPLRFGGRIFRVLCCSRSHCVCLAERRRAGRPIERGF